MAKRTAFISPLEGSRFSSVGSATSQVDYQPHNGAVRVKAISPPPPSSVFHCDVEHLSSGTSLSRSTYCAHQRAEPPVHVDRHKMYSTNFIMNADRNAISAQTTSRYYHHPIHPQRATPKKTGTRNPLGVRIVLPTLQSEYVGMFAASRTDFSNVATNDGKDAARDPILGGFMAGRHPCGGGPASTTYGDAFVSNGPSTTCQLSNMAAIQKLGTSYIPSGDARASLGGSSSYQVSYQPVVKQEPLYDKYVASKLISSSSVGTRDRQVAYTSTMAGAFRQPGPMRADIRPHPYHNASHVPQGDLDPTRVAKRMDGSTTRHDYPQHHLESFPHHVRTAGVHTLSQVQLGQCQWEHHYSTTAGSYSAPTPVPIVRARESGRDHLTKAAGYKDARGDTYTSVAISSYTSHPRIQPNKLPALALDNLKKSHWDQPYGKSLYFSTENRDSFTLPNRAH